MSPVIPAGVKVFFTHYRKFPGMIDFYTRGELPGFPPEPKGGLTEARLVSNGRIIAMGYADCSTKDNFNKAVGRNIALGRALKALNNQPEVIGLA